MNVYELFNVHQLSTWLLDHDQKVLWVNVTRVTRDM